MPSATDAKKPNGIHDAWQARGLTAAVGANMPRDALWRSVAPHAEMQKAMAQLSKPLVALSMEKMFPTANIARQLTALHTPDMTKVLGVGGVASMGLAAQIKATEQASLHRRTALAGITGAETKRLLAEMSSMRLASRSLSERIQGSYDVTALTRGLTGIASRSDLSAGLARVDMTALTRGLSADLASVARGLGVSALGAQGVLPSMPKFAAEALEEARVWTENIERFSKRWEQSALWFMLSSLSIGHVHHMADMERAEIEHDLLRALEAIVAEGDYAQALSSALDKAPHLTDVQRDHLQHGLDHVQGGEFDRAIPPLMHGMEGALWSTARALSVIDAKRRLVNRPRRPRARSIEPVIRELPAGEGFSTFVIHRVFGGSGNVVRHGELGLDGRQRALFLVVAVAGWLDAVMEVPAHEVLGHMLSEQLSADWRADH